MGVGGGSETERTKAEPQGIRTEKMLDREGNGQEMAERDRFSKTEKSGEEYERCVFCGKQTETLKSEPIDGRRFYIEGAGQLCRDCFYEIYVRGRGREN